MRGLRRTAAVAWLEVCRWRTDYRVWMVFVLEAALVVRSMAGLGIYGILNGTKTTPWLLPLLFGDASAARDSVKIMIYLGVTVLFCNAPFISHLTPSILLRTKRADWVRGEICYIFLGSALFLFFLSLLSLVCVLPTASFSQLWGSSLYRLLNGDGVERILFIHALPLPEGLMERIYPGYAFAYTWITGWLSFSFLGLLTMAVNMGAGRQGPGTVLAGMLVLLDPVVGWIASWGPIQTKWYLFSPVSWTSMEHLQGVEGGSSLTFAYAAVMYLLLIALLIFFICRKAKTMEIEIGRTT